MILEFGIVQGKLRCVRLFPVRLEGTTVRLSPGQGVLERMRGLTRDLDRGG